MISAPERNASTLRGTYDPLYGRLATMTDGTGTTSYGYYPMAVGTLGAGRLQSVDGPLVNDTVSYVYDEIGRVVSRSMNSVASTWTYDELGRLRTLGDPIGSFTYEYAGTTDRPSMVTYPNGQTTTYTYLPAVQDLRLQTIHHKKANTATLNRFDYAYDGVGNIITWSQQQDSNPAKVFTYGYDAADQLVAATLSGGASRRYRYAYDFAGNRTAEQIDDIVTGAAYDSLNRLVSRSAGGGMLFQGSINEPGRVTVGGKPTNVTAGNTFGDTALVPSPSGNVVITTTDFSNNTRTNTYQVSQVGPTNAFLYDLNGNLTGDGSKTYEWDARNQLVAVKQGSTTLASFTYDGGGRRATKVVGASTTTFLYDGAQFLEERLSGVPTKRYVYGLGVDRPLGQIVGGTSSFNLIDHLGNIVRVTDGSGSSVLTREYDPWGNPIQGAGISGYAYTGREWDAESGLYYYRSRFYSPTTARFLSEDRIRLEGGLNLYRYVGNNPVNAVDPDGACTFVLNRKLGGGPPLQLANMCSHSFVFTAKGENVKDTYSWGNAANTRGWHKNAPEDRKAAEMALNDEGYAGTAFKVGEDDFDPFVEEAFNWLNKPEKQHKNLVITNNCKTEARHLLAVARALQSMPE